MKKYVFKTERAFLNRFDGKIYAVCNSMGKIICDITEVDYLTLVNKGELIDKCHEQNHDLFPNSESDYILINVKNKIEGLQFKTIYGVEISIVKNNSI